jgi:hypothetical protein
MLSAALIWTVGCAGLTHHSEPLAGWHVCSNADTQKIDQFIKADYQSFFQSLEEHNIIGPYFLLEDGKGHHALEVEVTPIGKNASWHYALIYDENNRRIKTIKYNYTRYMSF